MLDAIDGVVVRLERGVDLLATLPALERFMVTSGLAVLGAIKLADESLAKTRADAFRAGAIRNDRYGAQGPVDAAAPVIQGVS